MGVRNKLVLFLLRYTNGLGCFAWRGVNCNATLDVGREDMKRLWGRIACINLVGVC